MIKPLSVPPTANVLSIINSPFTLIDEPNCNWPPADKILKLTEPLLELSVIDADVVILCFEPLRLSKVKVGVPVVENVKGADCVIVPLATMVTLVPPLIAF